MVKTTILVFAISVIFSFCLYILFFISPENIAESDFASFLTGAEIVKRGEGENLYNLEFQKDIQSEIVGKLAKNIFLPFRSLPFVALFFIPFTYIDIINGYKIFALINVIILTLSAFILSQRKGSAKMIYLFLTLTFLYLANVNSIFYGQLSILLFFLLTVIYIFLKGKADFKAGLLSGLLLIKPQYLICLPFLSLLSRRKRLLLTGFSFAFIFLFLPSFLVVGNGFVNKYLNFISETELIKYGSNFGEMYSLVSLLTYLTNSVWMSFQISSIFYLLFFVSFLYSGKSWSFDHRFLVVLIATLFFAPHVLTHDLTVLTLPLLFVLESFLVSQKKQKIVSALVFLIVFTLPLTSLWPVKNWVVVNAVLLGTVMGLMFFVNLKTEH